jgi:clan AA aspartic protease (TIGR02281 family)
MQDGKKHMRNAMALLAAFLLGWWVGHDGTPRPPADGAIAIGAGKGAPVPADPEAPRAPPRLLTEDVPAPALLAQLAGSRARGDQDAAANLRNAFLDRVLEQARAGRTREAQAQLQEYLALEPFDVEALLLAADLKQMEGQGLAAIDQLLTLLQVSTDVDATARARERLALLVGVQEASLANRGDLPGLVRLFESLAERDPGHDGHRLELARWLLRSGRVEEAERVLLETGTAGVDPQARADLEQDVRLARTGLPLEQSAGAMHVRATRHGQPLRLLVDTGATTTVLDRDRALALAATPTGDLVRVRTAAGIVEAELYLIRDLQVGALRLDSLPVLVMDHPLPNGVDGLLGMDVISRFGGAGRSLLPITGFP